MTDRTPHFPEQPEEAWIEAMARGLHDGDFEDADDAERAWQERGEVYRGSYRTEARAAYAALRAAMMRRGEC